MLEIVAFRQGIPVAGLDPHKAMVFPGRLFWIVDQLNGKALSEECLYQLIHSGSVVIPPSSVHVRPVFDGDDGGIILTLRHSQSIQNIRVRVATHAIELVATRLS